MEQRLDTYQRFLKRGHRNRWIVFINDILFWMIQGLIIFYVLFLVNHGELRFYLLLALICGFSAYQALMKRLYLGLFGDADPFLCINNKVYYKVIPDSHLSTSPRNHLIHACFTRVYRQDIFDTCKNYLDSVIMVIKGHF